MEEEAKKEMAIRYAESCKFKSNYPHDYHSDKDGFIEGVNKHKEYLPVANVVRRNAKLMDAESFFSWYNETFK